MPESAEYPTELEREVILNDGTRVRIRPIRPDDEPRLIALYARLSEHTAYQRFFTVMPRLPRDWAHFFANVDYRRRLALVAEHEAAGGPEVIGVAEYEPSEDEENAVEVAFLVQDEWQGRGLGTILFHDLLSAADARGIRRFCAYVLAGNARMLDLLTRFTDIQCRKTEAGVTGFFFTRRRPDACPAHG